MALLALGLSLVSVQAMDTKKRKAVVDVDYTSDDKKTRINSSVTFEGIRVTPVSVSVAHPDEDDNTHEEQGDDHEEDDDIPLTDSELASLNDSVLKLCAALEENSSKMKLIAPADSILLLDGSKEGANSTVESIVSEQGNVEPLKSIASEKGDVKKENVVHSIVYAGRTFVIVGVSSTVTTGLLTYLIEQCGLLDISPEAQAFGNIVIISAATLYRLLRASGNIERPVQKLEQTAQRSFGYRAGTLACRFISVAALSTLAAGTIANLFTISPAAQALMNLSGITAGGFYLVSSYRGATTANSAGLDSHDSVRPANDID